MVRVKQAFGVFILGTAVYYGYLSFGLFSQQRWVNPDEVANSVQEMLDEGWYASLGQGLQAAREEDKGRVPWQDGLPETIAASLRPYRGSLDDLACPAAEELALSVSNRNRLGVQAD